MYKRLPQSRISITPSVSGVFKAPSHVVSGAISKWTRRRPILIWNAPLPVGSKGKGMPSLFNAPCRLIGVRCRLTGCCTGADTLLNREVLFAYNVNIPSMSE
jgi:hypothetical protein